METQLQDYFNGLCCPAPVATFNFDVTADWDTAGIASQASFTSWVLGDNPNAVITNFIKNGNNIKCHITNYVFIDFETYVSIIDAFPNTLTYINLGQNDLDTASLDILCESLLTNNVLENITISNQSTNAQPSTANQTAISALCAANGGSANF